MGACVSTQGKEDKLRSDAIDQEIERDRKRLRRECKILLLGSGESGKSTIVKQMKVIHQGGYSQAELASFRPTIYRNLLESADAVVFAMRRLGFRPMLPKNQQSDLMGRIERWGKLMHEEHWFGGECGAKGALIWQEGEAEREELRLQNGSKSYTRLQLEAWDEKPLPAVANEPRRESDRLDPEMAQAIHDLFTDPIFKVVVEGHANHFYLMDSGPYFMEHAKRIGAPKYLPNIADVLRARARSVGIAETRFDMGPLAIHMFDVGGQRSERKKWIHCFEAVTSVIFCVALSEYDQVLLEASGTNRLQESLVLFSSIVHSQWFVRTSVVLFLNKIDVFRKKIPRIPLSNYFSEYAGGPDSQKATKFILWRFTQENRGRLSIYPHLTQATDTSKIKLVFAAIKETILSNSLKEAGVL